MSCRWFNEEKDNPWSGIYCNKINGRPGVRFWDCYCKGSSEDCPYLGGSDPYELVNKKEDKEEKKEEKREEKQDSYTGGYSGYSDGPHHGRSNGYEDKKPIDPPVFDAFDTDYDTDTDTGSISDEPEVHMGRYGIFGWKQIVIAGVLSFLLFLFPPALWSDFGKFLGSGWIGGFLQTGLICGPVMMAVWCTRSLMNYESLGPIMLYITAVINLVINVIVAMKLNVIPQIVVRIANWIYLVICEIAGIIPNVVIHLEDIALSHMNLSDVWNFVIIFLTEIVVCVIVAFVYEKYQWDRKHKKAEKWNKKIIPFILIALAVGFMVAYGYQKINTIKKSSLKEDAVQDAVQFFPGDIKVAIKNTDTAMEVLDIASNRFGIASVNDEYRCVSERRGAYADVYCMQQYYQGLEVVDYSLKVVADKSQMLETISGEYLPIENLDMEYTLSQDDAKEYSVSYLRKKYSIKESQISIGKIEPVIYVTNDKKAAIAYSVSTWTTKNGFGKLFLDGKKKKVLLEGGSIIGDTKENLNLIGENGHKLSVDITKKDNGEYTLIDNERNIYVFDMDGIDYMCEDENEFYDRCHDRIYSMNSIADTFPTKATDAMAYMEKAYDYFANVFNRKGINGNNNALYVGIDSDLDDIKDNAQYTGLRGENGEELIISGISTGNEDDPLSYSNTAAHEYAHGIISSECDLGGAEKDQKSQAMAINEGLADVFAELVEDWSDNQLMDNSCDWYHDGSRGSGIADAGEEYATSVDDFEDGKTDCHDASTIISHAAYRMTQSYGGGQKPLDNLQLGTLYYETITRMEKLSSFEDFRAQLEYTAIEMNDVYGPGYAGTSINDGQLKSVIDAMDHAGIRSQLAAYRVTPGAELTILDKKGKEYDKYSISITRGYHGKTIAENESTSGATYTLPQNMAPGYYKVTLYDQENPGLERPFMILVNGESSENPMSGLFCGYTKKTDIKTNFGKPGKRYWIFTRDDFSWEDAESYCESIGGHLAVISSPEENALLFQMMREEGVSNAYFGYTDSAEEGNWRWVTDEGSTYANWARNEPNNERGRENYAMFYFKYKNGEWNDGDCGHGTIGDSHTFICEWD